MEVGAHIVVRGLVQGVGFRFFVARAAESLHLAGTVENLFDGSVRIHVEGNRSVVEDFISKVKVGPRAAEVNDVAVEWATPGGTLHGFRIL